MPQPSISLIGDSQAGGVTNASPGLARLLEQKGYRTLRYFYRNGASTARLIDDLPEVLSPVPDIMIVMSGGNDNTRSTTSWGLMVDRLRAAGVRSIVWVGPPAGVGEADIEREAVSRLQRSVLASKGVRWISGRELAQGLERRDEVHLTMPAYATYARRVADAVTGAASTGVATFVLAAGALGGAWWLANRMAAAPAPRRRRRR